MSHFNWIHQRENAEEMLQCLTSLLNNPSNYNKFSSALPLTRICLLLLGDQPSPIVATEVLHMLSLGLNASSSFGRKFELVNGWTILRTVLPGAWNASVHEAAFDILLGRHSKSSSPRNPTVICPAIIPAILLSLQSGLNAVATSKQTSDGHPRELCGYLFQIITRGFTNRT